MKKKNRDGEKIIEFMNSIDKSVRGLRKQSTKYDSYIDEAAIRGDNARVQQLVKQKVIINKLADRMYTLKGNYELSWSVSTAMSNISGLPAAINGCKGLFAESPDFDKLRRSVADLFKELNMADQNIASVNSIFDNATDSTIETRLDAIDPIEDTDEYKAEMAAAMDRLKARIGAGQAIPKADAPVNDNSTGNIDFAGIMAEENKKK